MEKMDIFFDELISVIVPVYNVALYLNRCIESIVNQTYSNLEIVLVDDGSTDGSGKLCDEWGKKDSRICVLHKNNGGLSDARNYGLERATGKYVGFVDSDDWIERDMYEVLYKVMVTNHADISMCASNSVDGEGREIRSHVVPQQVAWDKNITVYRGTDILKAHLSRQNLINAGVWNKLYKREIVEGILFPVGKLYEDVFTTYKFLERAKVLAKTSAHEYNYFQRSDSICKKEMTPRNFDSIEANRERYLYIAQAVPELEPMARERMLVNYLNLAFRVAKEKRMKQFSSQIAGMRCDLKLYQLGGCGLNIKQQTGLRALRISTKLFSFLVRILY